MHIRVIHIFAAATEILHKGCFNMDISEYLCTRGKERTVQFAFLSAFCCGSTSAMEHDH